MNAIRALVILATCCSVASAAEQLTTRQLLGGKATMLVPASFSPMTDDAKRIKYRGANAPGHVLTNEDGTVNVAFDHKEFSMEPEHIRDLEAALRQQFAGAKINEAGMRKLNGAEFLLFDVETPAADGPIRNVMAMSSFEGRLLVISYNCALSRDAACGIVGRQIIESIKLTSKSLRQ